MIFVKFANAWKCSWKHEENIRRWSLRLACCDESEVKRGAFLCNDAVTVWTSRTSGHITASVCVEHQENVRLKIRYVWFSPQDRISDAQRTWREQSSLSHLKNYWQCFMFPALMNWAGQMFKTSALVESGDVRAQSKRDCSRWTSDLLSQWRSAWRSPAQIWISYKAIEAYQFPFSLSSSCLGWWMLGRSAAIVTLELWSCQSHMPRGRHRAVHMIPTGATQLDLISNIPPCVCWYMKIWCLESNAFIFKSQNETFSLVAVAHCCTTPDLHFVASASTTWSHQRHHEVV